MGALTLPSLQQIRLINTDLIDVQICDLCRYRGTILESAQEVVGVISDFKALIVD
jgi:hypothetical protein